MQKATNLNWVLVFNVQQAIANYSNACALYHNGNYKCKVLLPTKLQTKIANHKLHMADFDTTEFSKLRNSE